MHELVLKREPTKHGATFGRLYTEFPAELMPEVRHQRFLMETLEDAIRPEKIKGETCIPPGRYRVRLITSPTFGKDTPSLDDVPNFEYILIHSGNFIEDTKGCILVGEVRGGNKKPWVGRSRLAMARLVPLMKKYLAKQEKLYIRVENPQET